MIAIMVLLPPLPRLYDAILEDHLEHCIGEALAEGTGQKAIDDLKVALKRFIG